MKSGKVLDLFAGIGGMTLAAEKAGMSVVCAIGDSEKERQLYRKNLGDKQYMFFSEKEQDFTRIPSVDYIFGKVRLSDYCKKNKGYREQFMSEKQLALRLIKEKKPKGFMFVVTKRKFSDVELFVQQAEEIGYHVWFKSLDSRMLTGMPVHDTNVYVVGARADFTGDFRFPYEEERYTYDVRDFMFPDKKCDKLIIPPWMRERIQEESGAQIYNYKSGLGCYVPEKTIRYQSFYPTILNDGGEFRKLTLRELARTKFIPDEFVYDDANYNFMYRSILQTVNVDVSQKIICNLYDAVENKAQVIRPFEKNEKETKDSFLKVKETKKEDKSPKQKAEERHSQSERETKLGEIFLSYCQKDADVADLVEERLTPYICEDYHISRDVRDVEYKSSFRNFMKRIREHDYVLMIISDRYMRSSNCMYEMLEVFKDEDYAKKLLFIVLSNDDKSYYKSDVSENIAAEIYSAKGQGEYIIYWQEEQRKIKDQLRQINNMYGRKQRQEMQRIEKILIGLEDFYEYIADAKGLPLKEHLDTNFKSILNEIKKN